MNGNLTADPVDPAAGTVGPSAAPVPPPSSSPAGPVDPAGPRTPTSSGRAGLPGREAAGLRLLGLPVRGLVAVEALLAGAALAATSRNTVLTAAAGGLAVVGIGLVLARRAHRPLLAWVPVWWRRRGRLRRAATAGGDGDPRLAPLRELLPALSLGGIGLREGRRLAVCSDGTGWSAVLCLHREADILPGSSPAPRLPMDLLVRALQVDDIPLAGLQVLVHTAPAPDGRLAEQSPAVVSYRQLGGAAVPAAREIFLTLRLDARSGRDAIAARGGGPDGAHRALKRSASRLLELLDAAGVPARPLAETPWVATVLDVGGLTGTLPNGAGTDPAPAPAPALENGRRSAEDRRSWRADGRVHVSWWVRDFPDTPAPLQSLVELAGQVPAAATELSFTLHPTTPGPATGQPPGVPAPTSGTVRCRALLRTVARSPEAAEATAAALLERAAAIGAGLQRLDGEHGPGYLSTLPLGGGTL